MYALHFFQMSVLSELFIEVSTLARCSGSVGWLTLPLCCWEQAWMLYSHRGVWLCGHCQTVGIIEWKQEKHKCCMLNLTLNIPILEDTIGMMMELIQIKELSLWVNLSRCEIRGPEWYSLFSHPWRPAPNLIHTEEGVLRGVGLRQPLGEKIGPLRPWRAAAGVWWGNCLRSQRWKPPGANYLHRAIRTFFYSDRD